MGDFQWQSSLHEHIGKSLNIFCLENSSIFAQFSQSLHIDVSFRILTHILGIGGSDGWLDFWWLLAGLLVAGAMLCILYKGQSANILEDPPPLHLSPHSTVAYIREIAIDLFRFHSGLEDQ